MSLPWLHYDVHKPKGHVLVFHTKCGIREKDQYLCNIVFSLLQLSNLVTICTTEVDPSSPLNNIQGATKTLQFIRPLGRLPMIPVRFLNNCIKHIQMMSLVMQVLLKPPNPVPNLIITDSYTWAISVLKAFTSYRIIQILDFPLIYTGNLLQPLPKATFKRSTVRALRHADKIVVQTECLKQVMESSLSEFAAKITVLNPCYDIEPWMLTPPDVRTMVMKLPDDYILFAAFGKYKPRSNFEQILEAFRYFTYYSESSFLSRTRILIAGYNDPLSALESTYFDALKAMAEELWYKSNIIFLKQTTIIQQLSIINNCSAVLQPMNQSAHPGALLMAMSLKTPIVAADNGFAAEVLKNNVSGLLIDKMVDNKPAMFARKMAEILKDPHKGELLAESAKSEYNEKYSYFVYRQLVDTMITRPRNHQD